MTDTERIAKIREDNAEYDHDPDKKWLCDELEKAQTDANNLMACRLTLERYKAVVEQVRKLGDKYAKDGDIQATFYISECLAPLEGE